MRGFWIAFVTLILSASAAAKEPAYVAIIIDDVGHSLTAGKRALDLPAALTFSVLPYSEHAQTLAALATSTGKEVMIHMPMTNLGHMPLGPGALEPALTRDDFVSRLATALAKVPGARGLNNHMGSDLTQREIEMGWLMDEVKRRNLYFVDSRTTHRTVASRVAKQKSVFSSSRDVFLDNELTFFDIDASFKRLIRTAKRRGTAIAIAHPHAITLDYLAMALPALADANIVVVPASNLIALQHITEIQLASK